VQGTPSTVATALVVILLGVFLAHDLYETWPGWAKWVSGVLAFVLYGFYVGVLYVASPVSHPIDRFAEEKERAQIDSNDVHIVRLETDLASVSLKVESYMLESAFLGALAFSGFLTLITSGDYEVLKNAQQLALGVASFMDCCSDGRWQDAGQVILAHAVASEILALLAIETLVCAMLFLSVIVSRIRFYETVRKVDFAVRVARAFNDKEEAVHVLQLEHPDNDVIAERAKVLAEETFEALKHASAERDDMFRAANYSWIFRNAGVLTFVSLLISSAYLVSKSVAICFLAIALLSYVYIRLDRWSREKRLAAIPFFSRIVANVTKSR